MDRASSPRKRLGRPRKGERGDTREELLEAALKLFARQGYSATTVRQIAEVVGVRDSAIYVHFRSKRELIEELLQRSREQAASLASALESEDEVEGSPDEVLLRFCDRLILHWVESQSRLFVSMIAREHSGFLADMTEELTSGLVPYMRRWIEQGEAAGEHDPALLAWEFAVPLLAIRVAHLHGGADATELGKARELAGNHVRYFLACMRT